MAFRFWGNRRRGRYRRTDLPDASRRGKNTRSNSLVVRAMRRHGIQCTLFLRFLNV